MDGTTLNWISLIILVSSSLLLNCHFSNPLIVNIFESISNSTLCISFFIIQIFAEALKMLLLLRMTLLILGILDPGICAKYIELDRFYNIFPNYNFTLNFSNRNLRILEGIKHPVPLLRYKEEAIDQVCHTDIIRWDTTVVIDEKGLLNALGYAAGIDVEEIPVTKGASIVEIDIRYYNAFFSIMADNYYPLYTRHIWDFVLLSRHTLQKMIDSYFIKLGFFFSTVGSYFNISLLDLPFQHGYCNGNRGDKWHSDHLCCGGSYDNITARYMEEQQEQRWYRVVCVPLLTVHDVETLSETTFPMLRLYGDQDAFYTIHMSLLYGQMFGNEVSFYNYNWQTADWDMSYALFLGIDGCLFYITLALYFRKRFLCETPEFVCKPYRGRLWSKRKVYWRQKSISRAEYVQLARDRSPPHLPHRNYCRNDKSTLPQISRVVNWYTIGTL